MNTSSENIDFSIANRQSYVAILLIIYKSYRVIFRQLLPFIVIFFIGGNRKSIYDHVIIGIIVFAILFGIYGVISFFRFYFYIEDEELIIKKGVLNKSHTNIPFERIQTVDFEQNLIHRFFNVVKLKIDTAGSAKTEFEIQALSRAKAESLREKLLEGKSKKIVKLDVEENQVAVGTVIARLDFSDLLKIGISTNHFRSAGLILLAGFWLFEGLEDIGISRNQIMDKLPGVELLLASLLFAVIMIILFIIASFIISLIRTILRYYDLKFWRTETGFKLVSGLFNRREVAALDHKIQVVQWNQNIFQKWMGLYELFLKQASSLEVVTKKSINVPGIKMDQIENIKDHLYPNRQESNLIFNKVSKHFFIRPSLYISLLFLIILTLLIFLHQWKGLAIALVIFIWIMTSIYLSYKKTKYAINDEILYIRGGAFGFKNSICPLYKIQSVEITQNLYQQRRSLATVSLTTAASGLEIPYINMSDAQSIRDYLLFKVETSRQNWM